MSLAEIEAELAHLSCDELRRLALKSWAALAAKERCTGRLDECSEDDPRLLAALDQAIAQADASPGQGHSGSEVLTRLSEWTSR